MHAPSNDDNAQNEIVESMEADMGSPPPTDRDSDAPADKPGTDGEDEKGAGRDGKSGEKSFPNNVRKLRLERMMSKAELARRANLSVLTVDRVEKGFGCRMNTKRRILEALGLSLADRVRVFGEEE
jgi:ribosome-binding protein aMBF1 (putative translation factor)